MHINVKPMDRNQVYQTEAEAIAHLWIYGKYAKTWEGVHFGRDLASIRKADAAIRAKDASVFIALPRRGYWRIELKG